MDYTRSLFDCKYFERQTATVGQIEKHSEKVVKGEIPCNLPHCSRCGVEPGYFKRHENRRRQFYAIVEQIVEKVMGLLVRWKCPGCGKTFTAYPDFALPYKRYTLPTIMIFCGEYVNDDRMSYRKLIQKTPIGYPESENQLDHTTVFRWTGTFGCLTEIISKGQDLVLQKNPASDICRDLANLSVHPGKYRSVARKNELLRCRRLLGIEKIYRHLFDISIFPNLATQCGYS